METLPVLLSIPHGGTETPPEIAERICLSHVDMLNDSDAFSRDVYDLGGRVAHVVAADIGRAFVDPSRAAGERPPWNPDGAIKSHTCYGRAIYRKGAEPDVTLIETLLDLYYHPYHSQIERLARTGSPSVEMGIDCHSMTPVGPQVAPDPGASRPMFCLGNVWDVSCPHSTAVKLGRCLMEVFELAPEDVTYNEPFAGGYVTRHHGGHPLPWIQIEMNQVLYLDPPCFGQEVFDRVDPARLEDVKHRFYESLRLFFA